jgi:transposase
VSNLTFLTRTLTLKDFELSEYSGSPPFPKEEALQKLEQWLTEATIAQNKMIALNKRLDFTNKTKFGSADSRRLKIVEQANPVIQNYQVNELNRSEVRRILSLWQARVGIAEYLAKTSWDTDYKTVKAKFPYLKKALFKNIQRAGKLPELPQVARARIPLSKSSVQLVKMEVVNSKITLHGFWILDQQYTLEFAIPLKLLEQYGSSFKVCKPDIRLDEQGRVAFSFAVRTAVTLASDDSSVLGVDLGVLKPFSASRVQKSGLLSEEFIGSRELDSIVKRIELLTLESKRVTAKLKAYQSLELNSSHLSQQKAELSTKVTRLKGSLDWLVARDIVRHSKPGETIVIEDLGWRTGGWSKWTSGSVTQKIEHVGRKHGHFVKKVNAAYSSQSCPECHAAGLPDSSRVFTCPCGWSEDRDYTASAVVGVRGSKVKGVGRSKNRPTPKRPRLTARKFYGSKRVRAAFTGVVPTDCTSSTSLERSVAQNGLALGVPQNLKYQGLVGKTPTVLRARNFEDSEIVSNLRQMGNEDSHSTAGDVGITTPDGRSLDISLKAESNILNNSSQRDLGRLLGDEAFIAFNQSECEVADEKSLKIARELVLGKIRSDGALVDRYKSWIVDHTPKGAFLVQLERGRERGRVPIEAMDSIERWKAISGSQQKVLGSALSPHLTKLRTTNSDFLALETERNRAVNQGVSNMISKSSQENRRDMVGKMMSLRDTEAAYINYSNGEVHKALIPRRDEFKKRDEIRVGEPIVSKTSKGVIVPIFNEKDRTYSVIEIRTRFGDYQYNYAGIKVVTEYKETIKGVQEYLKDSTQFEGYQFSKPTENVFTKLT